MKWKVKEVNKYSCGHTLIRSILVDSETPPPIKITNHLKGNCLACNTKGVNGMIL